MAKLGDLILRVGADTSQLNKNLGEARKSIAKNTRNAAVRQHNDAYNYVAACRIRCRRN